MFILEYNFFFWAFFALHNWRKVYPGGTKTNATFLNNCVDRLDTDSTFMCCWKTKS